MKSEIFPYAELVGMSGITEFQKQVSDFIEQFGHLSDNGNDFSTIPWRETPDMVLDLMVNFTPSDEDASAKIGLNDLDLKGLARYKFMLFYHRTREFHLLRERIGAAYTLGYGLFRYYYLALGSIFVHRDWIDQSSDIFYLRAAEIQQLVDGTKPNINGRQLVDRHKADMARLSNISPPTVIYGDEPPPVSESVFRKVSRCTHFNWTLHRKSLRGAWYPRLQQG